MATGSSVLNVSHLSSESAPAVVNHYTGFFDKKTDVKEREKNATDMVSSFYELVTDFYEYGYGECFHFFPVYDSQSFKESLIEYEKELAKALNVQPGNTLLDIGCGIGGPGRIIARQTGATITGLNISDYQIKRAKALTEKAGLQTKCIYEKGDFCKMTQFQDNSFDGCYAIEATCHSQDPLLVYKEVARVLKPGAVFVDSAWVMTDKYKPGDPAHEKIKHEILIGNGLPDLRTEHVLLDKLREAGLEIVESVDYSLQGDLPWYTYLVGKSCFSMQSFRISWLGRMMTHYLVSGLEMAHIVPFGASKTHSVLLTAADGLVASGKLKIFSPMLRIVARKPLK